MLHDMAEHTEVSSNRSTKEVYESRWRKVLMVWFQELSRLIRFGVGWSDKYSRIASDLYFYKPSSYKPAGLFSKTIYGSSTGTILDQELGQYLKWYFYSIGINDISIAPEQEYDPYRSKYFLTVYAFW